MYKVHTNCRACGYGPPATPDGIKTAASNEKLESVFDLGVMPLPNAFRRSNEKLPGHYPIELLVCPRCNLGQLSAVVDPEVLYSDYPYVTSPSETMRAHFDSLYESLSEEGQISSVIEIGSNDGLLLEHFKKKGVSDVVGIDPASNLAAIAVNRGVHTVPSVFNRTSAETALHLIKRADLILARHVFCHVDDWKDFLHNCLVMSEKDTLVCIEVPYAQDTVDNCEWDQVYAEHLSYLTLRAMQSVLIGSGLHMHHLVRFAVHGGAIAIILRRDDSNVPPRSSVESFLSAEQCFMSDWKRFASRAWDQITNLKLLVSKLREDGKRITGYGASAKATVWINACHFRKSEIESVHDYTSHKLYCNIPGTDIPVVHEGGFYVNNADYAIVWAWNFLPEIIKRQQKWIDGGGKFIVPVPEVRIL